MKKYKVELKIITPNGDEYIDTTDMEYVHNDMLQRALHDEVINGTLDRMFNKLSDIIVKDSIN